MPFAGGFMILSSICAFFHKVLFPCPGCGQECDREAGSFCADCLDKLPQIKEDDNCCPGCGGFQDGALAVCSRCLAEPQRLWKEAVAALEYCGYAKELIRRFKFGNMPELARPFGKILSEIVLKRKINADIIVPVPLHPLRSWSRGYNQSELLARMVSDNTGIPVADILKRRLSRSKQSMRSRRERHTALKNAFVLKSKCFVAGKNILLLDDVLTTGATLHAAAKVLLKDGAASVTVLVLARTPGLYQSSF